MIPLMPSPGMPKMTRTPQSRSRSASTSAVVRAICSSPVRRRWEQDVRHPSTGNVLAPKRYMMNFRRVCLTAALVMTFALPVVAQTLPLDTPEKAEKAEKVEKVEKDSKRGDVFEPTPPFDEQVRDLRHALTRLPIAAGLAFVLAFRPRSKGTPPRQAPVIQTQIILAVVAVVMLVVGSSLARAFGIVGAAGLVRYRAQIQNPKDAGVMLSTLAVGLAAGVGEIGRAHV